MTQPAPSIIAVVPTKARPQTIAVTLAAPPQAPDYTGMMIYGGIGLVAGVLGAVVGAWAAYKFGLKASREANAKADLAREHHPRFAINQKLGKIYSAQKSIRTACENAAVSLAVSRAEAARLNARFLDHLSMDLRPTSSNAQRTGMSRARPLPPSGERSKAVMTGAIGHSREADA